MSAPPTRPIPPPPPADTVADTVADLAGALDLLLTDAALGPLRRLLPGVSWVRFAAHLAARPGTVARRGTDLARELARIVAGTSTTAPSRRDRRFADPAWTGNPVLRRIVQAYLAAAQTTQALTTDAGLEWRDAERIRFLVENLVEAAAPSNNPLVSPVGWRAAIETRGTSAVRGVANLVKDMASAPRVPTMVEPDAFEVGHTVALTPGAVVLRTDVFELIQYAPQTPTVRTVPLLVVPPVINKYYLIDIAPGRSLVEYLVQQGQQVFTISWRNPDARHRDWSIDTYGAAVLAALDGVAQVSGVDRAHLLGLCSGGIIASMVVSHLTQTGQADRVAGFSLGVTVLDQARAGMATALIDQRVAAAAVAASAARGYLDGRALAEVFAWMRPTDLVWNYWVNNYIQGRKPPAFDILYWNADTTRMAARLHRDFVDLALANKLTRPGEATMLGTAVDLSKVSVDSYIVAGISDHICPWQSCYRSTQLLGGNSRFVLSTAGHVVAMVNPPDNPKAAFHTGDDNVADPEQWLHAATSVKGSWWPDYAAWLAERSGPQRPAPADLGGGGLRAQEAAPGTYVLDH